MAIRLCLVVSLIGVALVVAGAARADADPASDVLYNGTLFLPYEAKVSPGAEAKLRAAIASSRAAGRPVRVALIASKRDLGGVPQLFGNPVYYARFLGAELQFLYSGRVLVVMPQGAGLSRGGKPVADKAVVAARPGPGGDALAETATELVDEIATGKAAPVASGSSQEALPKPSRSSGFPIGLVTAVAIFAVFVAIAVAGVLLARRRRA